MTVFAVFIYICIAIVALTIIAMILAFVVLLAGGFRMFGPTHVPGARAAAVKK